MKRNELRFQNHIIDSYEKAGGRAQKWASEWQANKPDLICALPGTGMHLMEVKHLPEWDPMVKRFHKNVLTIGQQKECKMYLDAGAIVLAGVILAASDARNSMLVLFSPVEPVWTITENQGVPYRIGQGYDIRELLNKTVW